MRLLVLLGFVPLHFDVAHRVKNVVSADLLSRKATLRRIFLTQDQLVYLLQLFALLDAEFVTVRLIDRGDELVKDLVAPFPFFVSHSSCRLRIELLRLLRLLSPILPETCQVGAAKRRKLCLLL